MATKTVNIALLRRKWPAGVHCLSLLFILLPALQASAQTEAHRALRQGDRAYSKQNYAQSEESYRKAEQDKNAPPSAAYNLGGAIYQQGRYEDALPYLERAAQHASDNSKKADALHNLGNAYLKQHRFKDAVQAYEKSLRLRPGDAGTKQNLQMAKQRLKQEQQQQQQQQDQQQNQQQQQQEQPQQNQEQNQQQDQQQQNQQQQQQQQNQQQQQQQQQRDAQALEKEAARRLLETAIGPADQRSAKKYREMQQKQSKSRSDKDW